MEKIKSSMDVRLRLLSTIYKILGSFSCEVLETEGVRWHNEMSYQAIPSGKATDKFYGLGSRNKHHSMPVCIGRLLSAMICISPRDSLNYSALCLQQHGRSCLCVCVCVCVCVCNLTVYWPIKCVQGTIPPSSIKEMRWDCRAS